MISKLLAPTDINAAFYGYGSLIPIDIRNATLYGMPVMTTYRNGQDWDMNGGNDLTCDNKFKLLSHYRN